MNTRRIRSQDAAAAAALVRLVRARPNDLIDPFPPASESEVLADMGARGKEEHAFARVAVEDDQIVGFGALDYSPEMKRCQLLGPVLHPAFRNRGYGRALLDDLLGQARSARQRYVRIMVGTANAPAQRLLERVGFKRKERHTCVRMRRPKKLPAVAFEGMRIERVEPEGWEDYYEFTRRFVPRQPSQTRSLLKADNYVAILARSKGRVIGCVEVDLRFGAVASVENLDAPPSLLHKGLGNALLAEAVRAAFEPREVEALDLLIEGNDPERVAAMTAHGFELRHELESFELRL